MNGTRKGHESDTKVTNKDSCPFGDEMKKIVVTLDVPDGQSCRVNEPMKVGLCRYYRSKSCVVFNAVIVDFIKSKKCQAS